MNFDSVKILHIKQRKPIVHEVKTERGNNKKYVTLKKFFLENIISDRTKFTV